MQQRTSIYIPKSCHEDWNKMTPTQQGKFCSACSKQVIDFSLMSDNQILNVISNQSGKLCGRFDAEQLQRPLIETKIKKQKSWWMALTMPLLFLFDRSEAQNRNIVGDTVYNTKPGEASICKPNVELTKILGKFASISQLQITIKGKVVDENNNPLAYSSVIQQATSNATISDSLGNFSLYVDRQKPLSIQADLVGYSSSDIVTTIDDKNLLIKLKQQVQGLPDVIVTAYPTMGKLSVVGGAISCVRIARVSNIEKLDTSFKKLIGASNVYPNPVVRGNSIHIKIKNTGNYQMQVLDNQSRLMQTEEINVDAKNTTTQIQLQSNIAAGMYYLRLINQQTKKQYTEKLIIQ